MRPLVFGGAAVGAVLLTAAGLVAFGQSLAPPPPQVIGDAVVVIPISVDDADYQPMTGLLMPQDCPEGIEDCPADEDP